MVTSLFQKLIRIILEEEVVLCLFLTSYTLIFAHQIVLIIVILNAKKTGHYADIFLSEEQLSFTGK